uniref:Uncharacterized protein n=1 Tax=Rhipicephalus zambeziensis TaxID=60191 RepID=A0A224YER3_9ACAR
MSHCGTLGYNLCICAAITDHMAADDTESRCVALSFPVNAVLAMAISAIVDCCNVNEKKGPEAGTYCLPKVITNSCDCTKEISKKRSTWLMRASTGRITEGT